MDIIQAIIIGLVQGLTEFLPVSSSAHLIFAHHILGVGSNMAFDVMLHVGTLVAVVVFFFKDILLLIYAFILSIKDLFTGNFVKGLREESYKRLAWYIIIATIPIGIVGVAFNSTIEEIFTGVNIPAFFLLITGCLLYFSQRINSGKINQENLTLKESFIVGCGQAIAILPGLSRSGTTISTSLGLGFDKEFAAKFSFLLSIPAILGAGIVEIKDMTLSSGEIGIYIAGFIIAAVSGYLAIKFLLTLIQKRNLDIFAYYCWIVGIIVLIGCLIFGW